MLVIDDATGSDVLYPDGSRTGLAPRDYTFTPLRAVEMPTIPRSEWSARIREMESRKSRLSDIWFASGNSHLDQNGQGFCHTADTEVLTSRGWVAWPDYNWSDPLATVNPATHAMEFQSPFERHVYDYDGPMVYSTNRRVKFGVTPDHQMYVRKWDEKRRTLSDSYSFVRAGDIGWYAGLLHAPSGQIGTELVEVEVPGDRRYDGDDFIALLGLIVSDGYAGGSKGANPGKGTWNWVSFASFREDVRPAVEALAARTGFHESPSRRGVWIRYSAGNLAAWLRENAYVGGATGARAKRVPDIVKVATPRQIKLFLHWFNDRTRDGSQFYSTSKRLIDDLQELHLRVGKRASIGERAEREVPFSGNASRVIKSGVCYTLTVGEADRLCIERKKHIETERYKGQVFCAAVPNHTLVTRRNGTVLISSNCWAYSSTHAVMALRAVNNQTAVRLSAHAVACKIKNFHDEGAWSALSLDFIQQHGVPSVAVWPEKSMNRMHDNPGTWAAAAKYRVTESWVDVAAPVWNRDLSWDQVMTCLLSRIPVACDFNWWGHAVCALDPVEVEPGSFGVRILNSWQGWGDRGTGVLRGDRAVPSNAVAVRAVTAAG